MRSFPLPEKISNITDHLLSIQVILYNSMGSWHMILSDYMSGRCTWKFNSIGVGVKNVSSSSPHPQVYFFWYSPYVFF